MHALGNQMRNKNVLFSFLFGITHSQLFVSAALGCCFRFGNNIYYRVRQRVTGE